MQGNPPSEHFLSNQTFSRALYSPVFQFCLNESIWPPGQGRRTRKGVSPAADRRHAGVRYRSFFDKSISLVASYPQEARYFQEVSCRQIANPVFPYPIPRKSALSDLKNSIFKWAFSIGPFLHSIECPYCTEKSAKG